MNPLFFAWDGEAFRPIPRHQKEADKRYVIGETYALEHLEERSGKAHRHFFASVRQAWLSLPEHLSGAFPTPESLRKHALIRVGFFDKRSIVAANKTEAQRIAAFIRPMDEYAIVTVSGSVVECYTAKSQSHKAMPKGEFQDSKAKVLDWIANLIGTDVKTLEKEGEIA